MIFIIMIIEGELLMCNALQGIKKVHQIHM